MSGSPCLVRFVSGSGQASYGLGEAAVPTAHVVAVGYPQFTPGNALSAVRHCPELVSPADVILMNEVAKQLNSVLARAAAAAGIGYVSTLKVLKGHELRTAHPWMNSILSGPASGQGHPNAQGQAMIAAAVEDYVARHHLPSGA